MKKTFLFLLIPCMIWAGEFDRIGVGARSLAMSSAYTGLSDDTFGIYYNPAGMANISQSEIGISYCDLFSLHLFNYYFIGVTRAHVWRGTMGLGWIHMGPGRDLNLGNISENTVLLSYGFKLVKKLNAGITLKFYASSYNNYKGTGWSGDVSFLYHITDSITAGLICQDVTFPVISWETGSWDRIDANVNAGIGVKFLKIFLLDLDLRNIFNYELSFNSGLEIAVYKDIVTVRGGFIISNISSASFGIGVRISDVDFDYSLANHSDLQWNHILGARIKI